MGRASDFGSSVKELKIKFNLFALLLFIVGIMLLVSAWNGALNLASGFDDIAVRVAECVIKEYKMHPERKSIQAYCEAEIRLDHDQE